MARLEGLPNYEQLADTLIRDVITTIQEARNDAATVPALPAPAES